MTFSLAPVCLTLLSSLCSPSSINNFMKPERLDLVFETILNILVCTSVGTTRGLKGLSELLLLLRHFSDILIFWKIFKVNRGPNANFLSLVIMSVFET